MWQRMRIVLCGGFLALFVLGILLYGLSMASKSISVEDDPVELRPKLVVAVSSSVPIPSVQQYVRDTARLQGEVIMRGLIGTGPDAIEQTLRWLREVTERDMISESDAGVGIAPALFEKLPIERVPATVLINAAGLACLNDERCGRVAPADYALVYGNVTLAYALQVIAFRGGPLATTAHRMVQALNAP